MEEARAKCPNCGSAFPAGATFCPECGYVVPVSAPVAAPPVERIVVPTPQPGVVYVQPQVEAPREANWGPWVVIAVIILLAGGGFALWSGGYLGGSPAATPPTTVTIDNSPQMSTETPQSQPPGAPAATPAAPPPATPPPAAPAIDIVSVKGQALETNDIEWKYGYTMVLRNNTDAAVTASFRIQFLDEQDFPVDDALMNDLVIPAHTKQSYDGVSTLKAEVAQRIRTVRAEMR